MESFNKDFPKISKVYKKKDWKKDLLAFAKMGYSSVLSEVAREKFAENDYKVPDYILDEVNQRVEYLLEGTKEYAGIDAETAAQIQTILRDNLEKGIDEVVKKITESISSIATNRAKLIAESEVSNIVEGARYAGYVNSGWKYKRWLSVNDSRVRDAHRSNDSIGVIKIEEAFPSGESRAGQAPRCRCTTIYAMDKGDINDDISLDYYEPPAIKITAKEAKAAQKELEAMRKSNQEREKERKRKLAEDKEKGKNITDKQLRDLGKRLGNNNLDDIEIL